MPLAEKFGTKPLRLLIVGHNPSEHSWESGKYFSQPTNNFWKLVKESGLCDIEDGVNDDYMVENLCVGFTDVIRKHNSDSRVFKRDDYREKHTFFYKRIKDNALRVGGAPERIAFIGKKQYSMLFNPPLARVELGLQKEHPTDFPFECEIWVLSTPSGRFPMKWDQRVEPYKELADSMHLAF